MIKKITNIFLITLTLTFLSYAESNSQWKKLTNIPPPFDNNYYLEVYFLPSNPQYGWICGYNGFVIRTTNGGNTWAGTIIPNGGQLESVILVDSQVGYASGEGRIYRSDNGGASFYDVTPPDAQNSLVLLWGNYFTSRDIGMVIGDGCGDQQRFYRTTDGGRNWDLFLGNASNTGMTDLILYSANGLGYASSSGFIWITQDGGQTWNVYARTGDNDWQEDLAINGNSFLVPYSKDCSGGGNTGGLRFSQNNGRNWKQFSTGQPMFGTFLNDPLHGWGVGWNRSAYYTSDGGNNWVLKNCGIEPGANLDDIWFINDTLGFVVGQGVYRSHTYNPLEPKITPVGPISFCPGDSIILTTTEDYPNYIWSNGDRSSKIVVRNPGRYFVKVWSVECDTGSSNVVEVSIFDKPQPKISVLDSMLCKGDTTTLSAKAGFISYNWSTGENTRTIRVNNEGKYFVTVTDSNGCQGIDSAYVHVVDNPQPVIRIIGRPNTCIGDTIILETDAIYKKYFWYDSTGNKLIDSTTNSILVVSSGKFFIHVVNEYGCEGTSASIEIIVRNDSNRISILDNLNTINFLKIDSTYFFQISCKQIRIKNIGPDPVILDDALMLKNIPFSLPQSQFPVIIQPSEIKELTICYSPTALGEQNDTLIINDHCSPHIIPIQSSGLPNIYSGGSKCGTNINMSTFALAKDLIDISPPIPNPAGGNFKVNFIAVIPNNEELQTSGKLFNTLGIEVAQSFAIIQNKSENNNNTINGEFRFDVSSFTSGIYFVVLKINNNSYSYQIAITM